ncbi:lipocalin family protein [Bdellovibrio sp. HCB2-146]|uniref:lipocalin family protein n=1 Tax=Bdellovibrio sp. HCB2-146 TaxID=3394362 RepID=UPI0039BC99F3
MNLKFFLLTFSFVLGACGTMSSREPLRTVNYVDIPKFMGDWYVIANIPTFVEKGAYNAIESYSWNTQEKRIDVDFRYNKDSATGPIKRYPQKAWIYDSKTNAEWRVQPWWPLKFAYLVIDLAPDYSYTVIGVPDRKYVWIMARNKTMEPRLYESLVAKLQAWGYDISKLQKVPQL